MPSPRPTTTPPGPASRTGRALLRLLAVTALLAALVVALPTASRAVTVPDLAYETTLVGDAAFTGGGLQQPSIIHASEYFDDPLGEYYLYFGTQNEGGIGLAYGDSPTGPFTAYEGNPVVRSVSGPHAIFDEQAGELLLYLHGDRNVAVSTSSDGIDFSAPEALLNGTDYGISRLQLPRVFEYTLPSVGNRFTMLVMGIDDGVRKVYLATSDDGRDWTPRLEPVVSPAEGEGGQIASPHLLEWEGEVLVAYHASSGNIHWTRTGPDFTIEEHLGVLHAPMDGPPDNGRVAAPAFVDLDGELAMLYEAGSSSSAVIAIATADGDGEPDLPDPPAVAEGFPEFTHQGLAFEKADQDYNPTGEFIFPSIIRASDHFDDPLGEYYLYYAPHDSPGGISLQYGDSLDGPWTEYEGNPIITNEWPPHYDRVSHVSSPHAVFNDQEGKLFLYYHGENTVTRYATSADGVSFDYGGDAVTTADMADGVTETSYARVFEHTLPGLDNRWIMLFMGNDRGTRKLYLATSDDGRDWTARTEPIVSPGADESGQLSGPWFFPWEGEYYVVYHSGSGTMHVTEVGAAFDREDHLGIFYESSTGKRAAAPSFITQGDTMYMFHELGDRLNADIAWATADISEFLPDDETAPTATLAVDPSANDAGWHDGPVTVTASASDDGSGVAELRWTIEGASTDSGTSSGDSLDLVVEAEGVTTVTVTPVDEAGNVGEPVSVVVRIDATAPDVSCAVDPTVVFPPNGKLVDVSAAITVDDDTSGPDGVTLDAITTDQGDVAADTAGFDVGTDDTDGRVRATRDPRAGDRTYTITWTGSDVAGNTTTCTAEVVVPVAPPTGWSNGHGGS